MIAHDFPNFQKVVMKAVAGDVRGNGSKERQEAVQYCTGLVGEEADTRQQTTKLLNKGDGLLMPC